MMKRMLSILVLALAAQAQAQSFPSKPVRIVIPFSPGGSADLQARSLGQKLSEGWGQPVLVEPKPGAGTTIGAAYAASQPADGHTLYFAGASLLISGNLYKNLSYHPVKGFAPVSMVANSPYFLAVHPGLSAANLRQLIDLAKAKPKTVTYASAGNGSGSHLAGELFRMLTATDLVHVPYKGQAPAFVALAGGEVNMLFADVAAVPLITSGKMKALAVTSDKRSPALPNVPTIAEQGFPGYEVSSGFGMLAPASFPAAMVRTINSALVKSLQDPSVRERLSSQGAEPVGSTPEAHEQMIRSEIARWTKIVQQVGIKATVN